jgi:hypothetical protein
VHKRIRIAFSTRMRLLQADIDICDATIRHIDTCPHCKDDDLCPEGQELYDGFMIAHSRGKLLTGDTDVDL